MSFGETFQYQKSVKVLENGDYNVTLLEPFFTTVSNFAVVRFPFLVDDESVEVRPNYFDLFDCTDPNDKVKREIFNNRFSRIMDCFKIGGAFTTENFKTWAGHKGKIRVEKNDAGFTNVTKFYKNENEQDAELFDIY